MEEEAKDRIFGISAEPKIYNRIFNNAKSAAPGTSISGLEVRKAGRPSLKK